MNIKMFPVTSSQIKSVGYDKIKHSLFIEFSNGVVYEYYNCYVKHYESLIVPTISVGTYFKEHIKSDPALLYSKTKYVVQNNILITE